MYTPSLNVFTCVTCGLCFESSDGQKAHFRTDLHRFNLKRKTVGLPPVSQEAYDASRAPAESAPSPTAAAAAVAAGEEQQTKVVFECAMCKKRFRNARAFELHYESRKHRLRARDLGVSPDLPEEMAAAAAAILSTTRAAQEAEKSEEQLLAEIQARPRLSDAECLFCSAVAVASSDGSEDAFAANLAHMAREHGFFVPDLECCTDLRGLVAYLAEKVAVWTRCLWCSDRTRSFYTLEAVRRHMCDIGHCKMCYDDPSEYAAFYDWSQLDFPRGNDGGDDGTTGVEISENGLELLLPDGRVAGHRALQTVYSQTVHVPESRESVLSSIREQALRPRIQQGAGSSALIVQHGSGLRPAIAAANVAVYAERTRAILRRQAQQQLKLGVKSNALHIIRPQINV